MMADDSEHRLTDGVSVDAVKTFLADLKSEFPDTYTEMTTEDACKQLVVPRTRQDNCAYVDLLRKQSSHEHVGKATVFVSHAWRYKIADVLNVLLEFAEEQRVRKEDSQPVFFWFDLFMNNQNANITANLPQEWWSTTFKESIANIGRVLLVLMPWRDPVPLTRAWCLWEIFCGISNEGTEVNIRLPNSEEKALEEAIRGDFEAVTDTLVRVQAERAEAFNPHDKDMIFEAIQNGVGFAALNQAVKDQLRAWCLHKMVAAVEAMRARGEDETAAFAALCTQVGSVMHEFGEHGKAIAYYETALPIALRTEGEDGRNVAGLYDSLGIAYTKTGEYDKAIEHFEKALAIKVEVLGEKHPSTAHTYGNFGLPYLQKGENDQAIKYFERSLAIKAETLGERHPDTALVYNNIGGAYENKAEYGKAIEQFQKALAVKVETLGEKHPSTAQTYGNLGNAYYKQGKHDMAIEHAEKALQVFVETLGENHPNTAQTYKSMGRAYVGKSDYIKAMQCYKKALAITARTLGEKHPDTATAYLKVGILQFQSGDVEQARTYIQRAHSIYMATLGPDHPNTRRAAQSLQLIQAGAVSREQSAPTEHQPASPTSSPQQQETTANRNLLLRFISSAVVHRSSTARRNLLLRFLGAAAHVHSGVRDPATTGSDSEEEEEEEEEEGQTGKAPVSSSRQTDVGGGNVASTTALHDDACKHSTQPLAGWLQKRGRWNTAFRTRWCMLDGGHLLYSTAPERAARRHIPLSTVQSAELTQDREELHVAVPGRTFVFRLDARSELTLADWRNAIEMGASGAK